MISRAYMSENLKKWVDISKTIITITYSIRAPVGANNKLEELEALSIQIQIYLKKKKLFLLQSVI